MENADSVMEDELQVLNSADTKVMEEKSVKVIAEMSEISKPATTDVDTKHKLPELEPKTYSDIYFKLVHLSK